MSGRWSKPLLAVALVAMLGGCVVVPVGLAVEASIGLLTAEPVRVETVACTKNTGRQSGHCTGSWELSDGTRQRGELAGYWFVSDGESFDGYGGTDTATPSRLIWVLQQGFYAVPIGAALLVWRKLRYRRKTAGAPISAADEAAMNARAAELRRRRGRELSTGPLWVFHIAVVVHRPDIDNSP